jgi:hypothetical protein
MLGAFCHTSAHRVYTRVLRDTASIILCVFGEEMSIHAGTTEFAALEAALRDERQCAARGGPTTRPQSLRPAVLFSAVERHFERLETELELSARAVAGTPQKFRPLLEASRTRPGSSALARLTTNRTRDFKACRYLPADSSQHYRIGFDATFLAQCNLGSRPNRVPA